MTNLKELPESESMMRTLVSLARNIGMMVVIEGIETQQQLDFVRTLGASVVQGFLLGRPTPHPIEDFLSVAEKAAAAVQ